MSDIVIESITRPERKVTGSWLEVIASNLDYHRATFLWKCAGLSAEQLQQRSAPPSELSLLWLMRHLRGVERYWFQRRLAGTTPPATDPTSAAEIYADYLAACAESREVFAKVTDELSRTVPNPEFGDAEVRFVLTHLIEEYARAWEEPELFAAEVRAAFRPLRAA